MDTDARIIVVGGDAKERRDAVSLLHMAGFARVAAFEAVELGSDQARPDAIVVAGRRVVDLCREARSVPLLARVPLLAMTQAPAAALGAGADDILTAADPAELVAARICRLIAASRDHSQAEASDALHEAMLQVYAHSGIDDDSPDVLREMLLIAGEAMDFDRTSLLAHLEGSQSAYVIASTDDPTLSKFVVAVANYPEIRAAMERREPVLIDDVKTDPLTAPVAHRLAKLDVRGVAVFPLVWRDKPLGVVFFRRSRPGVGDLDWRRLAFGRMFAKHVAARLRHGKILEKLREQTQRITRARYEAERRLRSIESLAEHFDAAADGVLVIDDGGRILYMNRAAESITGFARDGVLGADLGVMVPEAYDPLMRHVVGQVLHGHNLEAFDMELSTTSGEPICVSVTTSTVLGATGAAVLSFRDVTAQRLLEAELRKTKEFLEKLVDSTVDAIVAADMHGNVLLFNQGAERLFGYVADEVIGILPVWKLYSDGVARQIMRMLRSTQFGGVGRLEQIRREIMTKHGELVPVNMSASVIYEDGHEVATVGIMSDLRERIRIEQRLLQAQEKLVLTEKQAVIAELAGAAAHELNQPLTSIMGYAQLIQRHSGADGPYARQLDVIMREAERMAEIVRKIGRITMYETKEYVGKTRMIDLDRSSPAHRPPPSSSPSHRLPEAADESMDDDTGPVGPPALASHPGAQEFDDEVTTQVNMDVVRSQPDSVASAVAGGPRAASAPAAPGARPAAASPGTNNPARSRAIDDEP